MDRALPAGNRRVPTGIISGSKTLKDYELVTFCRELIIKSELVTTDGIETDRFYKFDGAIVVVLTILTASRQKMSDAERHLCYRKGRC